MKKTNLFGCLAMILLLAGCSGSDVHQLAETQPVAGNEFTRALTAAYRYEANIEGNVDQDWPEADALARKGLAAANGEAIDPNVPRRQCQLDQCSMPADRLDLLESARARLMVYFANGSRERAPAPSAMAQAKFDCWLEEEEWGFTDSECKTAFLEAEPLLKPPTPQPPVVKAVVQPPAAPLPKIVKTFTIYFNFNKIDLTKAARKLIKEVAEAQNEIQPLNIYLAGHTDTVGGDPYNDTLSLKRVSVVGDALGKMGVKTTIIDMKYFGKHKLNVPTGDETSEPMNRRVEIAFEK